MNKQERLILEVTEPLGEEKFINIGRLLIGYDIASDYWSSSYGPSFKRFFLSFHSTTMEDYTWLTIIIHKIKINIAIQGK